VETPKETLHELERGSPGKRFQRLYRKRQESRHGGLKNILFIAGGLVVIGVGVVTYPIPVIPSEIAIVIGIALISQGSRYGAIALDKSELWLRKHFSWAFELWGRLSKGAKIAVAIAWTTLLAGLSYGVYKWFSD